MACPHIDIFRAAKTVADFRNGVKSGEAQKGHVFSALSPLDPTWGITKRYGGTSSARRTACGHKGATCNRYDVRSIANDDLAFAIRRIDDVHRYESFSCEERRRRSFRKGMAEP